VRQPSVPLGELTALGRCLLCTFFLDPSFRQGRRQKYQKSQGTTNAFAAGCTRRLLGFTVSNPITGGGTATGLRCRLVFGPLLQARLFDLF